mmetsp:Transcript_148551/g.386240  ORF Transcript_148551/g.386240 Transcript_148551/m.386240 type:complete len:316 (-) Transcript_148551:33-980(-)
MGHHALSCPERDLFPQVEWQELYHRMRSLQLLFLLLLHFLIGLHVSLLLFGLLLLLLLLLLLQLLWRLLRPSFRHKGCLGSVGAPRPLPRPPRAVARVQKPGELPRARAGGLGGRLAAGVVLLPGLPPILLPILLVLLTAIPAPALPIIRPRGLVLLVPPIFGIILLVLAPRFISAVPVRLLVVPIRLLVAPFRPGLLLPAAVIAALTIVPLRPRLVLLVVAVALGLVASPGGCRPSWLVPRLPIIAPAACCLLPVLAVRICGHIRILLPPRLRRRLRRRRLSGIPAALAGAGILGHRHGGEGGSACQTLGRAPP